MDKLDDEQLEGSSYVFIYKKETFEIHKVNDIQVSFWVESKTKRISQIKIYKNDLSVFMVYISQRKSRWHE